jgi:hypothetical protein
MSPTEVVASVKSLIFCQNVDQPIVGFIALEKDILITRYWVKDCSREDRSLLIADLTIQMLCA